MINVDRLSKAFRISIPGENFLEKGKRFLIPRYKYIQAVNNINFAIKEGEIIGFLGPNGAGKSTTIKLLTGVLVPNSGMVRVNGIIPYKQRIQNAYQIGVVYGQRSQLWWDLPLIDSFKILKAMYRLSDSTYKANLDFFVDLLQMKTYINQPVRKLSLGQRMRADICAALLHDPPVLYLDEPTIGLDIIAKNRVYEFIRNLNAEKNTTIILTTHNLSDVESVCPRILIVDKGNLILDAPKSDILKRFGKTRTLTVTFYNGVQDINVSGREIIKKNKNELQIKFNREEVSAFDLIASMEQNKGIKDVSIHEDNIESIVAQIYEKGAEEGGGR